MAETFDRGDVVFSTKNQFYGIVLGRLDESGQIIASNTTYKVWFNDGSRLGSTEGRIPAKELQRAEARLVNPRDYGMDSEEELFRRWRELAGV